MLLQEKTDNRCCRFVFSDYFFQFFGGLQQITINQFEQYVKISLPLAQLLLVSRLLH